MGKIDEIIYSDLFRRIYSRDVLKILEAAIPVKKSTNASIETKTTYASRSNKGSEIPYKIEEIIDALLFIDSDLSTEKIFCLFTLAKQNFINRINKKPSTFSLTSLEERTNSVESQRHIDYGRISFMGVNPQISLNSSAWDHLTRRRTSQSSQRSSISIEDPDAPYSDKLEYLVDYIFEVLLVIYPEKLRMVLELEQCYPMYMKVLSTERNVLFMEQVLGNRLTFKSFQSFTEQKNATRFRSRKHNAQNASKTSARDSMNTSDNSLLKKCGNSFFNNSSGSLSYGNGNSMPNNPLRYIKSALDSSPLDFKTKLKNILIDFVTNNVEPQARFHRTPSGRSFETEPTSRSGLVQTVVLKVDNQPLEKHRASSLNPYNISEDYKRKYFEIDRVKSEIGHEVQFINTILFTCSIYVIYKKFGLISRQSFITK